MKRIRITVTEEADTIRLIGQTVGENEEETVFTVEGSVAMQLTEEVRNARGEIVKKEQPTGQTALLIDRFVLHEEEQDPAMEDAAMDALVKACRERRIAALFGYFRPGKENEMIKDLYGRLGFRKVSEDGLGNTAWKFDIPSSYINRNRSVEVVQ